jgi:hypothetical protein
MRHEHIIWNPATQEWFCRKCGKTSDHVSENDAHLELEQQQCQVPSAEMPKAAYGSPIE